MKWHPIDTAPHGEWILAYILPPPEVHGIKGYWLPVYFTDKTGWVDIFEHPSETPSYWTEITEPNARLVLADSEGQKVSH